MKILSAALLALAVVAAAPAFAADALRPLPYFTPTAAPQGPQGWVGVDGGWVNATGTSGHVYEVTGAANVPMGAFNFEIEGRGAALSIGGGTNTAVSLGMVHAFWRNQAMSIGVFGGLEQVATTGLTTIGVEGQAYFNNLMLYGQYASQTITGGGGTSLWYARGSAMLFLGGGNFALDGDAKYLGGGSLLGAGPVWEIGVGAEARMAGAVSLYANYRSLFAAGGGGGSGTINTTLVGVRLHIGNQTLKQAYTTGASMNTIPLL
jgi:hypothetical protein